MPAQTNIKKYWFPDGTELAVSTDSGSSYTDVGAFTGGINISHEFDKIQIELGNAAKTDPLIKNQTLTAAPTPLVSWDLETIEKLGGGIYNYTSTAATIVSGAEQVVASGAWGYNDFIKITNQNGDLSAITINSVTGGTNGALVAGTDYFAGTNSNGESGIFVIDSTTVTTEAQTITINYDYTPVAKKKITAGDSSLVFEDYILRIRHYSDVARTLVDAEMFIWKAAVDSGLAFNIKGVNEEGLNEITMAFTANVDSTKSAGTQLFSLEIAESLIS